MHYYCLDMPKIHSLITLLGVVLCGLVPQLDSVHAVNPAASSGPKDLSNGEGPKCCLFSTHP
jgi:hypothetical protein